MQARQRIGILGPESDDELDEVDGLTRCYQGSSLYVTALAAYAWLLPSLPLARA